MRIVAIARWCGVDITNMHCTLELPPVELRMYAGRRNDANPTITPAIVPGGL